MHNQELETSLSEDSLFCTAKQKAIDSVDGEVIWNTLPKIAQQNLIKSYLDIERREADFVAQSQLLLEEVEKDKREVDFHRAEMFRIDRATLSIDDMDPTRSEILIEQSREYKEKGQEVMDQIMDKKITGTEGRRILDEEVARLKRQMDVRRHKTKSVARKKIERNYEKLMKKGWDKRDFDMDTVRYNERELISADEYSVHIPSFKVFIDHAMVMKNSILSHQKKEVMRPEHYCMASVCLSGRGHFYTKTNNMPVLTPDGDVNHNFYPTLVEDVRKKLEKVDEYEESSPDIVCKQVTMSYTISQWESIKNWYPENTPTMPIKKFLDFSVFLASNEEVNCEQQCVEYLIDCYKQSHGGNLPANCSGTWDPTKGFVEMIPQNEVLTYLPCQGDIRYVTQFSDLMTSFHENVSTNDCKNIARIIKWNDHMAVITELKPIRRRARLQYRKPLLSSETNTCGEVDREEIEVFVDIEAFNKDCEDNYAEQVPYLVCWADNDEVNSVCGEECMAEFVDQILSKYGNSSWRKQCKNKEITLYAWYGSGYDYQHIYPYLKAKCTYDQCKLRNNSIIYAEFVFEHLELTIYLKDPFLFILTSLDKAAKAFGVINKGKFPHQIIKDWPDLDQILDNWIITRHKLIEEYDNNRMVVYVREWEDFEAAPNHDTVMRKATEYCTIDVLAMQQVWTKFTKMVSEQFGMEINKNIFTLSQLSMKLMEACLPPKVWLYVPSRKEYDFIHNAIYGGRVIAKNGDYQEQILYADVVSLYPSAMRLLEHGYGKPTQVSTINWNKHGIYDVTLTHKEEKEPKYYMPFVPRRIDQKLYWKWFKQYRGVYHTYDLLIAKDQGYKIECHEGLEYTSKGHIFDEFIDKLYKLKEEHSNCCCGNSTHISSGNVCPGVDSSTPASEDPVLGTHVSAGNMGQHRQQKCPIRMIAKIALNGGGYGKFVQKPIDIDTYIVRRDVIAGECNKLRENENGEIYFGGTLTKRPTFQQLDGEKYDKMIFENESEPYYATQAGISILSGSRYRLYNLCKEFPKMDVIYSDTDSIFVRKSSVDWELFKQKCGTELGQLDDTIDNMSHGVIKRMLVGGPKMYAYEYYDSEGQGLTKTKLHCKGVPTSMLSLDQFEHLLKDEDKYLAYSFSIMRKRIVGVQNQNIIKLIKKT